MYSTVKCKQCRSLIFDEGQCRSLFLSPHGAPLLEPGPEECLEENVIFLNEDHLPRWIMQRIEADNWAKGRINCQQCDSRIGAFNFVSGQKCSCANFVLPFVHIIRSKVDLIKS